jgi:hypothetical protein
MLEGGASAAPAQAPRLLSGREAPDVVPVTWTGTVNVVPWHVVGAFGSIVAVPMSTFFLLP